MSTMRKIKKSFTAAKQNVMEKTHSRENTQETQLLKDFERRIDDQTFYLRKICKNIKKETTSIAASVEDGNALADTFIDYGVKMRDQNDLEILTGVLSKVGEFQVGLEDLRAKLNTTLINDVSDPLHTMVKTELKMAKDSKARYDKIRVQYDGAIADLSTMKKSKSKSSKLQEAETECERQKVLFDTIEHETVTLMQETSDVSEFETVEKLCDYLEAYHKFFQKGFRWLNQMLPDIYEYRLYVERRKSELENSKVRASMMATQPGATPAASPTRLFGEDLMTVVKRDNAPVPRFITESFNWIKEKALDEEGIFRLSGNKREVMEYKAKFDQGFVPGMFADIADPNLMASLIKMYLRELPDPLLTYDRYKAFLATVEVDDQDKRVAQIASIVDSLPPANHELLRQLLDLCTQIAAHKINKMGAANLATVMAPNILVTNSEDVHVDDVSIGNIVITTMIQHVDKIFTPTSVKTFDWIRESVASPQVKLPPGEKTGGAEKDKGSTVRQRRPTIPTHPIPVSPQRAPSASPLREELANSLSSPSPHIIASPSPHTTTTITHPVPPTPPPPSPQHQPPAYPPPTPPS